MTSEKTFAHRRAFLLLAFVLCLAASLGSGSVTGARERVCITVLLPADAGVAAAKRLAGLDDHVMAGPARIGSFVALRLEVAPERAGELAAAPGVARVWPWVPPRLHDERSGQILAGAIDEAGGLTGPGYGAWLEARGLAGPLGLLIDITDSGLDRGTPGDVPESLRDPTGASRVVYARDFTFDVTPHDLSGHGTFNASIAAGAATGETDSEGFDYGLGIAPGARIGSSRIFRDNNRFNLQNFYTAVSAPAWHDGARVSSNSWGSPANSYTPDAMEYDAIVRDADPATPGNQEMIVVFSAGNGGPDGHVETPGTAKNVITVGAAEGVRRGSDGCVASTDADSALDLAFFSGGGPTDDGRIKPDIVAPGTHIVGARSRAEGYTGVGVCDPSFPGSPDLFSWSSGTSHAAPAVSGAAALLYAHLERARAEAPSPALVKAWLLNSTRYLTGAGARDDLPSPRQGWGLLDLERALDGASRVVVDRPAAFTSTGDTRELVCAVADPARPVRITLAWTDAPGTPGPVPQMNDLDLEVEANGSLYRGNRFVRDQSIPGGVADARNNVEGVWLPPGAGPLRIRVRLSALRGDGVPGNVSSLDQDFALVGYNLEERAAPVLRVSAVLIEGEAGGAPQPGGSAVVRLTVVNDGTMASPGLPVTLRGGPGVTVLDGEDSLPPLAPGASATTERGFRITLDPSVPCGASLGLEARVGGLVIPVLARAGDRLESVVLEDDVEGAPRWTPDSSNGGALWAESTTRARSGARSWFVPDAGGIGESSLLSEPIVIPADAVEAVFEFYHTFAFEPGFDGGVVEVSDGGPFVDLGPWIVAGAYESNVSGDFQNPLGTRPAWTGGRLGEFELVRVDLTPFAGRTVRLRLRAGADLRTGGPGWFVDDLRVTVTRYDCRGAGGELPTIVLASYANGKLKIKATGLAPGVVLEINGRPVLLPVAYRADKGTLKIKASPFDLNLRQPGANQLVIRVGGVASRPYALVL